MSKLRQQEKQIVSAALRLHYWFMQPTDRDERNCGPYNRALGDLLDACARHRRAIGKKPPSPHAEAIARHWEKRVNEIQRELRARKLARLFRGNA